MSQFFQIHPETPQKRLINQAVDILRKGGVIVYPTDSAYAIGCHLGDKQAADRIKRIRRLDDKHNFTLMCRDLSDIGVFAKVDNTHWHAGAGQRNCAGAVGGTGRTYHEQYADIAG